MLTGFVVVVVVVLVVVLLVCMSEDPYVYPMINDDFGKWRDFW